MQALRLGEIQVPSLQPFTGSFSNNTPSHEHEKGDAAGNAGLQHTMHTVAGDVASDLGGPESLAELARHDVLLPAHYSPQER